ncbi:MAG: PAS domain S-box protein [Bacteroidota bacterium]|nr:PAS domain S-box protein [Bacteroidota bacterium]
MKKNYSSWTKKELIDELGRSQERIDRFENADDNYRPDVRMDFNENLFSSDRDLVNTVLGKIEEFVYFIEINSDGSKLVRYVGPQLKKILGITADHYITDTAGLVDRCHPDDLPGVYATARKLRTEKQQQTFIYRFLHAGSNEYVWLEETVFPQFDSEGKYTANLGIIRNVSERIESDRALRESRMSLEKVLNTIDETIYHIDLRKDSGQRIKFVSESIETVFGISKEAFLNDKDIFLKYYHPEDLEKIRITSEALQKEKLPKLYYYRFRRPGTNEYIWIEERVTPWFDEEGNLTEMFGVARDVTEQKTAEEKLIKSEERFRVVAQNASDMVFRYRFFPEQRYVFVSPSAETIMGYTPEEFYADPFLIQKITFPSDVRLLHNSTEEILAGRPEINSPMILRNIRKDGANIWTETRYNPTYDEAGRIIAIDGITRDITASKKSELEMMESRESYKSLVEQNPDGIIIAGFDQKIIYSNKAATAISGIADLVGFKFMEFLPPDQQVKSAERIQKIKEGQQVPFEIIKIQHPDGSVVEAETRPSIYNYLGKPAILIFLRNINAERQLEKEQMRAQLAEESNRILTKEVEERKRTESELFSAQKNLRLLIDSSLDMICASDNQGRITEFNRAAQQSFGYSPEEVIGRHVSFLYLDPSQRIGVMEQLEEGIGNFQGEVANKKKNGETFTALLSASVLKDEKGNVVGSMGVSRDITDAKRAEKELRLNEEKYRAIYNQAYIGIALVGTDNDSYIDVNQRLCDMLGFSAEEMRKKTVHELRKPGDLSRLPAGKEFIERGFERIIDEHRYGHKNGSTVIVNVTISLVRSEDLKPLYFVYVYEDLTPKRRAEEQIRIQAAKLNAVFESSSHMIWTIDKNTKLTSFNQNQADWIKHHFGITAYVGLSMGVGKMISTDEDNEFWSQKLAQTFAGSSQSFQTATHKDREASWREIFLNPIFDENERVVEVSCIANDITDKKMVDEQIRLSLKEKEVLLKEVHHRVKNNLQVISSILNLQSSYVKDKRVLEILLESQNRIKSMAFVHESLYQTKDFSNISFREYVENISRNLVHSYAATDSPPLLNLDLDDIQLNLDTAIPCGLIINELLTNSLKYAFPVGKQGKIDITIREKDGNITINITDNGKGLPKEIDFRNTESLGLQLVVSLVEQINGKIRLDTKKGTKFTIEFST